MKLFIFTIFICLSSVVFAEATKFGAPVNEGTGQIVEGTVTEVCQKKGCFMKVNNGQEERFVRFKDYGFFVPTNLVGKKVRMKAVEVSKKVSVKEQKHFLEDAKASPEKISNVKKALERKEWLASGVEVIETK